MVGLAALLDEARRAGLRLAPAGDRLVIRGPKKADRLARALLEYKVEVLALLRREAAVTCGTATLTVVDRVHPGWEWLLDHRRDLVDAIKAAEDRADDPALRHALEAAAVAFKLRNLEGVRIYSRLLDSELWLAADEPTARELEATLAGAGAALPVVTFEEADRLGAMAEADARTVFRALRAFPGSRLRHVGPEGALDA